VTQKWQILNHALRQTEGLIGSITHLLGLTLAVPDHTTLNQPSQTGSYSPFLGRGAAPNEGRRAWDSLDGGEGSGASYLCVIACGCQMEHVSQVGLHAIYQRADGGKARYAAAMEVDHIETIHGHEHVPPRAFLETNSAQGGVFVPAIKCIKVHFGSRDGVCQRQQGLAVVPGER